MWFLLVPFVPKEPCSRPGDPDIAPQSNVPRCLLSPTSNEMPNSQLCPDISGGISGEMGTYPYGAFKRELGDAKVGSATGGSSDPIYSFKASRSNSVYGPTSYGVSVDAVYTLIIIKA